MMELNLMTYRIEFHRQLVGQRIRNPGGYHQTGLFKQSGSKLTTARSVTHTFYNCWCCLQAMHRAQQQRLQVMTIICLRGSFSQSTSP